MKQVFTLANLALVTGVIYFSVSLFYGTLVSKMDDVPTPGPVDHHQSVRKSEVIRPASAYAVISDRNLFKTDEDAAKTVITAEPEDTDEDPEITNLDLTLWGTVTGNRAWAFIEDKKKKEQLLFEEGQSVQGAIIKKIHRDKVLLSLNDKVEVLEMEQMVSTSRRGRPSGRKVPGRPGTPAQATPGSAQKVSMQREEIDSAIGNLNEIMRQAKLRPHFKNGKPDGLTLTRVKPDSIFTRLGLRSGDIITGVDGEEIQSVDDALKFYNSLKSASGVALQIKRRGRDQTIEYNIE